jgi:hypothetical protein
MENEYATSVAHYSIMMNDLFLGKFNFVENVK